MKNRLIVFCVVLFSGSLFAQNPFEGTFIVDFRNEKKELSKLEVKVKGPNVYLKSLEGGISKYGYYLLNLETRDFYTVSKPDKKVAIKYDLDKLLALYENQKLKEGFQVKSSLTFKVTEKSKEENGMKMTKLIGEDEIHKSTLWLADIGYNFNQFIPLLRLLGVWNEAQLNEGFIASAEVSSKVSKRESAVSVSLKKSTLPKEIFEVPKEFLQKDFAKLMEEEKGNKDLTMIIQTFAGF